MNLQLRFALASYQSLSLISLSLSTRFLLSFPAYKQLQLAKLYHDGDKLHAKVLVLQKPKNLILLSSIIIC